MSSHFIHNPPQFGEFSHGGSIIEFKQKIWATWYAYKEKEYEQGQIVVSHYDEREKIWAKPQIAFPMLLGQSCGNPMFYADEESDELYLFFVILGRHYWDSSRIYSSKLEKDHWSSPNPLPLPEGLMIRHSPKKVSRGEILIPAYDEKKSQTHLYKSLAPYKDWQHLSSIEGELIQGDLVQSSDKEWQIYMRPALSNERKIFRASSADGGKSWSKVFSTGLPCPLSGLAAIKLKNRGLLICYNHSHEMKRHPLSLAYAKAGSINFEYLCDIETENLEFSYPSLLKSKNEEIHLIYTFNRRMMKHRELSHFLREKYGLE